MKTFTEYNTFTESFYSDDFNNFFVENFVTYENELLEKSERIDFKGQPWGDVSKTNTPDDIYNKAVQMAKDNQKEFFRKVKFAARKARNAKVVTNEFTIKPEKSFKGKITRTDVIKKASEITDMLRTTITVESESDIELVTKAILKEFKVVNKKGGYVDIKSKGKDKVFGYYGSTHFLVDMNGMTSEIQLMTKRMAAYKEEAHKFYDKYRNDLDKKDPTKLKVGSTLNQKDFDMDKRRSKTMFAKGNIKNNYYNR